VVSRPGQIRVTPTHIDTAFFDIALAELSVRRAGLDIDPGLGAVVPACRDLPLPKLREVTMWNAMAHTHYGTVMSEGPTGCGPED
jgi:hypothetical protein